MTIPGEPFCRSSLTHFFATCSDSSDVMSYTTCRRTYVRPGEARSAAQRSSERRVRVAYDGSGSAAVVHRR
jgi:hypothetical protein